jgi:glycosyltransferase involved in cell wall biosynthesis
MDIKAKSSIKPELQTAHSAPIFSIVIPAHNEERFIADCLKSLKAQNFHGNFEIIVVDNNSSDNTALLAKKDGVKVVFEPKKGVCAARQTGTEAANGSIIISTDADTTFAPDWLSKIGKSFMEDAQIVAVSGPCSYINAPWWGNVYTNILFGIDKIIFRLFKKVWYTPACNIAFKKEVWPGYNIELKQGGDEFDFLRKIKKMGKVKFLEDNVVFTSSRRLRKGLFYNLLITLLFYYLFNYFLGLIFSKSPFGSYPAFRDVDIEEK